MKLVVKRNREIAPINSRNSQNENKAETIELSVPEEYESFNKKIVFITPNETVWDVIVNNQYKITNAITKYDKVDYYIWLTKEVDGESIDFRTKTKTLNFYHNEDASDEITDEEIHGVNTVVNLLEEEIEKVENLNIEATKIGDTTTVTITKKDGTTESVEINDGTDGQDGYTPQKGVDYFTEQDIEEIETDVKNDLEENVLVNYSLIAETGAKIELSINTTDYKLKAILKDKNNNIIHTSNVIDLPLETMVVNATYDNTTKKIILTLQNGTTVEFSIADLVSGLVSESQLQTILANYYTKTEINNLLNNKVDKVQGKELSSNDFTDALKEKLEGLENYDDTEIKADISDIQDEQIEQNTDIEALQTENARLKATLPTTTGEGQDITLDKTAELEFIKPPLPMGNSEQESTEGYQLLDTIEKQSYTQNGITVTNNGDGSFTLNGTNTNSSYIDLYITPNTNSQTIIKDLENGTYLLKIYELSGNINFNSTNCYVIATGKGENNQVLNSMMAVDLHNNEQYQVKSLENCKLTTVKFYIGSGVTFNNYKFKIMLAQSSDISLKWEPYTNGASPNPDYPQEITNVTGDVEVVVRNKNLFNKETVEDGKYINNAGEIREYHTYTLSDYISVKPSTKYSYQGISAFSERLAFYDKNKNLISVEMVSTLPQYQTITTPSNCYYFRTTVLKVDIDKYQFEENSISTNFVEHKEQVLPLTLGNIELCKIGDYQDYFYKESNKWYLHKEIGKVVLDGVTNSLTYHLLANKLHCGYINLSSAIVKPTNNDIKIDTLSNRFLAYSINIMLEKSLIGVGIRSDGLVFFSFGENSSLTSTELINQFLQNNNNEFYYPLATPTDTEIIDTTLISQLEAINNALSYEEQTNISSNTIALFNVEAYQSTKLVLEENNAKYESLEARVALLE